MAKQSGIIKLEGTIGDVTFYKSKDGLLARSKGGVDASRIQSDESFQRTRENNSEFGRAGSAGKLLRLAFRNYLQNAADSKMVSRLTKSMMEVVKADSTSIRGNRNVLDGELELLQGFDFNIEGKLSSTLYMAYTTTIDRVAGTFTVSVPAFTPTNAISAPSGATHARFIIAGADINFEANTFEIVTAQSADISLSDAQVAGSDLSGALHANSTNPLFLVLGVEFYQQVNGVNYALKGGKANALCLVKVSGV
jgi:hypothetical protein